MSEQKQSEYILLPPTAASPLWVLWRVFSGKTIALRYWGRWAASVVFSSLSAPFRLYEQWRWRKTIAAVKVEHPPVFLIGHWRSGTTLLHNLLSQDPQMGYVTTYHATFPSVLLSGKWLFKTFMELALPRRRAGDNVQMNANYPQEEEFALGNMGYHSLYYFWYFPTHLPTYYNQFAALEADQKTAKIWKENYSELVKKALVDTQGSIFLSKNPPNTARIKRLLELYPDAKFVYIYRNPIDVFLSTQKFFSAMLPYLQFETISPEQLEAHILQLYICLYNQYEQDKGLIPAGNLVEVRYEDLVQRPMPILEQLYADLSLPNFNRAQAPIAAYAATQKDYEKNKHYITAAQLERVLQNWQFAMDKWGYSLPANLEVV